MALSAAQIAQYYEIIGIPQGGASLSIYALDDPAGASGDVFSHAAVCTLIDARLAALSAENVTRIGTHLTRWDAIGGSQPILSLDKAGSIYADYARERGIIRDAIKSIAGIYVKLKTQPGNVSVMR